MRNYNETLNIWDCFIRLDPVPLEVLGILSPSLVPQGKEDDDSDVIYGAF